MTTDIRAIFVIPEEREDETECSQTMHSAFQACKANGMEVEWVKDCTRLLESELQKTDFVVFERFEGEQFTKFKSTKATIVGPSCVLTCLVEGRPIPNLSWPIYNLSMLDCVITASHVSRSEKESLRDKIQMMAGQYTDDFFDVNTHLITDSVKSKKYLKAAEVGVKLMLPTWVGAVWEAAKTETVHCNDERFDKYRCLPLHKLTVCTTGFTSLEERAELKRLVKENGGTYTGQLHVRSTDVLICKDSTNSEKFKAARKSSRIKSVSYNWLLESVAKGYALKDTDYTIKKCTSTPTKMGELVDPNFSVMSAISSDSSRIQKSLFQETTINITTSFPDVTMSTAPRKRKSSSLDDISDVIDGIDLKSVKRAGSFLDGCCVYIAGFTSDQWEKMSRILNLGGATRYDQISDRITHVIVGDPTQGDVRTLRRDCSAPIISLQWLCECIRRQQVVNEEDYLVSFQMKASTTKTCDSPISQKGLKLLRREISKEINPPELESQTQVTLCEDGVNDINKDIIQQYLQPNATSQEDTLAKLLQENPFNSEQIGNQPAENYRDQPKQNISQTSKKAVVNANSNNQSTNMSITVTEDELTEQVTLYNNKKFLIMHFDKEETMQLQDYIEKYGGEVIAIDSGFSMKDEIHNLNLTDLNYIIIPVFNESTKNFLDEANWIIQRLYQRTKLSNNMKIEILTDYFITHCYQNSELVSIEYYHKPVLINKVSDGDGPLRGSVVTISSYSGVERIFLNNLIVKLGGISQEQLCRVQKGDILASTHLLNPEPCGKKYEAAIRWGLPVVNKDWLLECAKSGNFELEDKYLVGEAKAPIRPNIPKPKTPQPSKVKTPVAKCTDQFLTQRDLPVTSDFLQKFSDVNSFTELDKLNEEPNSSLKENQDANIQIKDTVTNKSNDALNNSKVSNTNTTQTPNTSKYFPNSGKPEYTPLNRIMQDYQDSPQFSSQVTPVNEIMNRFKMNNMIGTPTVTPELPRRYGEVDTPETPYGAFIRPNPSPRLRKECLKWINGLPEHRPRRNCTPFSELKRRLWDKITHKGDEKGAIRQPDFTEDADRSLPSTSDPHVPDTPQHAIINSKLQQLQQMLSSSGGNRSSLKRRDSMVAAQGNKEEAGVVELKSSQACTVGWDYDETAKGQEKPVVDRREMTFMITSLENNEKENLIKQIEELGSRASELQQFDVEGTHLLAPKPQRTEKMLSCIAAGKWILHPSYIEKSIEAGRFLEEDAFEFGNPRANKDIMAHFDRDKKLSPQALHYWRVEVNKRGYGAFHDMRAIIISSKRDPIVRIIEAGGGMVIEARPPFDHDVYATHCLVDSKTDSDLSIYVPLAKQGIYCVNITYIYDFLYRNIQDVRDAILPEMAKYYVD